MFRVYGNDLGSCSFCCRHDDLAGANEGLFICQSYALFSLMAASVGLSPTDPDTAVTTQSAAFSVAASMSPSIPLPTRISVSASRVFRSFAAFSSNIATNLGFNSLACCSTRSVFYLPSMRRRVHPNALRQRCSGGLSSLSSREWILL